MKSDRLLPSLSLPRRLAAFGLLAALALAFYAPRARAAGETLTMVQNDPTAIAGHATNFTASGTLNPEDTMFGFDIYIFVKDPAFDPSCGPDFESESATAMHSGGHESWVSPPGGFQVGAPASFSQPFKITFTGSGNYLLCGYVNGDFSTFAAAELRGSVAAETSSTTPTSSTPGGSTPTTGTVPVAAAPGLIRAPWVTRKGHRLTCHAGSWSNAPTSFTYSWYVKGRGRSVASGRTLNVSRSLQGQQVVCSVTARNAGGAKTVSTHPLRAG
jgi:hypothetical protein